MSKIISRLIAVTDDGAYAYKEKGERKPIPWKQIIRLVTIVCGFRLAGTIFSLAAQASPLILLMAIGVSVICAMGYLLGKD